MGTKEPAVSESVEFDCLDCGAHVFGFGRNTVPDPPLCFVCDWVREFIPDPVERATFHEQMREKGHQ